MPFRGSGSGGGEIKLLRAKLNLFVLILFLGLSCTKLQDPWECSAPSASGGFQHLAGSGPMAITQKRVSIVCTETEELGSIHSLRRVWVRAVICGSHFTRSLKFLGCWRSYSEPKDLLPWKWVGTRRGNTGSAIDNAYLGLWKHCKQREKFLLPRQLQ